MKPEELIPGVPYPRFVEEALRHRRESSFRSCAFYRENREALQRLLTSPRVEHSGPGTPLPADPLRVIHWNIEKGKGFGGIRHHLLNHPYLRGAGLWCLNEVDSGTARSGNIDQAAELARAIGCDSVYLPSFIECTRGTGTDLARAEGENRLGLHGLAILSRAPVIDARAVLLPPCHDYFDFHEKRFGYRQGLYARLDWGDGLIAATTHLEVRNTPQCRARQFAAFLQGLEQAREVWGRNLPIVITGDWNTNTFRRGSLGRSLAGFLRIVATPRSRLEEQLIAPFAREPLFALLRRAGFEVEPYNEKRVTARQGLAGLEDLGTIPPSVARVILHLFRLHGRSLGMRVDWIAARGLAACSAPRTLDGLLHQGEPVSDHDPIGVDLRPAAERTSRTGR
jgi:endonuclease/exonuclease/phosphatase family metal-dependent hydrolase